MTTPNHDNLLHCFWTALVISLNIFPFFWFTTSGQQLEVIFAYIMPENNKLLMHLAATSRLPSHFLLLAILPKPQGWASVSQGLEEKIQQLCYLLAQN